MLLLRILLLVSLLLLLFDHLLCCILNIYPHVDQSHPHGIFIFYIHCIASVFINYFYQFLSIILSILYLFLVILLVEQDGMVGLFWWLVSSSVVLVSTQRKLSQTLYAWHSSTSVGEKSSGSKSSDRSIGTERTPLILKKKL